MVEKTTATKVSMHVCVCNVFMHVYVVMCAMCLHCMYVGDCDIHMLIILLMVPFFCRTAIAFSAANFSSTGYLTYPAAAGSGLTLSTQVQVVFIPQSLNGLLFYIGPVSLLIIGYHWIL